MLDWLLIPIDPSRPHDVAGALAWHGRLMVLAWCILLPAGILAARFFKITPRQDWPRRLDNKAWWYAHNALQYGGGIVLVIALIIIMRDHRSAWNPHTLLGWSVAALTLTQFLGGWLRGSKGGPTDPRRDGSLNGDHYDMTPRRRLFERVHKSLGYLATILALCALATGLWQANAPRWMWLAISGWWVLLVLAGIRWQRQGRAVDTYQAIWGPDPSHPGNCPSRPGRGRRSP